MASSENHSLANFLLEDDKYLNIVILGETGVGKSTWINSFFNYIMSNQFEEALKIVYLPIHTKFKYKTTVPASSSEVGKQQRVMQEIIIDIGPRYPNMQNTTSTVKSTTRFPTSYELVTKRGNFIRIIDTPGISDNTHGENVEENRKLDDENISNILHHLSQYQQIDAFVILMKPNEERLSEGIRYCIKKLFSQLHSSASKNIVFGFTHAKSTDFEPGSTIDVLKELFEEIRLKVDITLANMFFFDNSPFRYLTIKACGHQPKEKLSTMKEFWEISSSECFKMLHYVEGLEIPHNTYETKSIQEARMVVELMTSPLVEMCNVIKLTQEKLFETFKKAKEEGEEEAQMFTVNGVALKYQALPCAQTVCTNSACCHTQTFRLDDETNVNKKMFPRVCCQDCQAPFSASGRKGKFALKFCKSFSFGNTCRECQHPRSEHMHIRYKLTYVSEEIRGTITELQERSVGLQGEYNLIIGTMGYFTFYQRKNKLTTFCDSVTDHLDDEIKRHRLQGYVHEKDFEEKLNILEELRSSYQNEYERLEACGDPPSPEDIDKLRVDIFALPLKGKELETVYKQKEKGNREFLDNNKYSKKTYNLNNPHGDIPKKVIKASR